MGKERGQTLIETLISILIIAFVAIALIRFESYLAYTNSLSQQNIEATVLALSKIETLRDFQVLYSTAGYTAYQDIASGSSTASGNTTTYSLTWTISSSVSPLYKSISVVVSWPDRYGNTQSITQISDIAGIEPQNSAAIM